MSGWQSAQRQKFSKKFPPTKIARWRVEDMKTYLILSYADLVFYCKIMITTLFFGARGIFKSRLDIITLAFLQCWQRNKIEQTTCHKKQKEQKQQQQQKSIQMYFHICLYFKAVERLYHSEFPPTNERFVAHTIVPHAVIYAPSFGLFGLR